MTRGRLRIAPFLLAAGCLLFSLRIVQALNPSHECSFCHDLHGASGTELQNETDTEVLCLTCHGSAGTSSLKAEVHFNDNNSDYDPFEITCIRCHDPHSDQPNWLGTHVHAGDGSTWSGTNIKLVGYDGPGGVAIIQTTEWDDSSGVYVSGMRSVVFEQLGDNNDADLQIHSFADADQDGNGVKDGGCETCHTQTKHHCNGDPTNTGQCGENHNTGRICTNCHGHDTNFQRN